MKLIFEGNDLFWLFVYYGVSFASMLYSGAKLGDWLATKIIRFVERK